MTTWVEDTAGGRGRGPRAVLRAWVEIILRPRRFFRTGVAPADQGPGLVFAMAVVAAAAGTHLATRPPYATGVGASPTLSLLFVFALYVVLVGPVVLHLVAAAQTVFLVLLVPDRGGVSETVQVIAYATAPCALAGLPLPGLRLLLALWGAGLLVLGTAIVHDASPPRALAVAALPAALVFGYGFGGVAAATTVWESLIEAAGRTPEPSPNGTAADHS
jgi:hypothetical protein